MSRKEMVRLSLFVKETTAVHLEPRIAHSIYFESYELEVKVHREITEN